MHCICVVLCHFIPHAPPQLWAQDAVGFPAQLWSRPFLPGALSSFSKSGVSESPSGC